MRKMDWIDIGKRAGKTFVQAFVAAFIINIEQFIEIKNAESVKAAIAPILIAALSAGLSATWNMMTNYISETEEE